MLYAKFMYPDNGWDSDVENAKKVGLKVGEKYEVEYLSMGQSNTSIYLKGIQSIFNSVQFDFEEDGKPINIYDSPNIIRIITLKKFILRRNIWISHLKNGQSKT